MSASNIHQLIRAAAAHEDAASRHEDKYEQQMKSAGASMYQAFTLALAAAPEFQGRRLDEKAVLRIYQSTRPRQWWDAELVAARLLAGPAGGQKADRERAKRLIQWHVDPAGAASRRAQHALKEAARRKSLNAKSNARAQGARVPPKSEAREARHAAKVTAAAQDAAVGHRGLDADLKQIMDVPLDDLMREVSRMGSAVKRVPAEHRGTVREALVVTAREVERYIA